MAEKNESPAAPVQRLCSEIQLFDLCEKDACALRSGRFCTDPVLLAKFEALSEPEDRIHDQYMDDEEDEGDDEFSEYGDGFDDEVFEDEE